MTGSPLPSPTFWRDKRVLLTGHTGFKGGWLALWLHRLGARVTGISLAAETTPALHQAARIDSLIDGRHCDIRDAAALRQQVLEARPEIVLHLAAQALVRPSYAEPVDTFATNVMGTAHLLDALRSAPDAKVAVMVTTDKVYRNNEWPYPYREHDTLGGHDPYSASKAASELVIASYRDAFLKQQGLAVASARAGNVIGGGDWSVDRLLPDAVRAWRDGGELHVRRPQSVRPWQHVLEPLAGYLTLAETLWRDPALADAYNFGPDAAEAAPVRTVIDLAQATYGRGRTVYAEHSQGPHEAGLLTLDTSKARAVLGVAPRWPLATAVTRSMDWYRRFDAGEDALALCQADIDRYAGPR
ncbi:CDP-glucose 4,6-dehydratase [Achromobacter sp. 2789STDY5608621]|uniref:CDP-glucose 4,6-dehydratase n=1 Tax=Achromobacter sp. 2789STDY5608621 TaxID=1806496 RepID=UPI0006C027B4|nr:CDP-glucose 4,6-dehydratase [Achromobacter sp. 2789STDY5608621]CUJ45810.1 CDP-glucose 4%2C6-dehydratase [Achromobacter sp. 2789STDY5608621]